MTYDEIKACESGTPVSLADGKFGTLVEILNFDREPFAYVAVYGEPRRRVVPSCELVDIREGKGMLVQLRGEH